MIANRGFVVPARLACVPLTVDQRRRRLPVIGSRGSRTRPDSLSPGVANQARHFARLASYCSAAATRLPHLLPIAGRGPLSLRPDPPFAIGMIALTAPSAGRTHTRVPATTCAASPSHVVRGHAGSSPSDPRRPSSHRDAFAAPISNTGIASTSGIIPWRTSDGPPCRRYSAMD